MDQGVKEEILKIAAKANRFQPIGDFTILLKLPLDVVQRALYELADEGFLTGKKGAVLYDYKITEKGRDRLGIEMNTVEFMVGSKQYRYNLPPISFGAEVILQGSDGREKLRYTGTGVRYLKLNPDTGEWQRKGRPGNRHVKKLILLWLKGEDEFIAKEMRKWKNSK